MEEVGKSAPKLRVNYNVIDGIVFPEAVDRPEDYPYFMNIRRITLDEILVNRLKATPNVDMIEGAKAKEIIWEDGRAVGVEWKDKEGKHSAKAKAVIGADGARSFVAKEVAAEFEHQDPVTRTMYYAYFSGVAHQDGPAAEFHYNGNEIGYLMPTDGDLTLLAVSTVIDQFSKFRREPEGHLMDRLNAMVEIKERLAAGKLESKILGTGTIYSYKRIPYGQGWVLVGDAGMALDPWSGQGIDQGSTHAVILAKQLGEYLGGKKDWDEAMQGYHQERNEFSKKAYRQTTSFSRDLRPMTAAALAKRGLKN
jgi:2-polyprenyl-6-methoxyphenol hydroxylase-like FAD-dependent oxidoreductase